LKSSRTIRAGRRRSRPRQPVERGGLEERRTLAFRDYLREHVAAARDYEDLKRALAAQPPGSDAESRERYARAKTDFIERVVALAIGTGYPRDLQAP
jgi:GrpB-like predicted nucleotidyltransferase (UPF0157 family)